MKKTLSIILVLALALSMCLSLASCGPKDSTGSKDHYVVGIIQLAPHPALDAATQGFKDALTAKLEAEGKTVEFKYENAQGPIAERPSVMNIIVFSACGFLLSVR